MGKPENLQCCLHVLYFIFGSSLSILLLKGFLVNIKDFDFLYEWKGQFVFGKSEELQGSKDALNILICRSFSAKEPLIIGLFCGKWPMALRHPKDLRHPIFWGRKIAFAEVCTSWLVFFEVWEGLHVFFVDKKGNFWYEKGYRVAKTHRMP